MTKPLPSAIRAEIEKGAKYNVNPDRKHDEVMREMNKDTNKITDLKKADVGFNSKAA